MENELHMTRPGTVARKNSLLVQITAYVEGHLSEKITLKAVAAHCGVSVSTVTQLFQRKSPVTFHQYLTRRRMEFAQTLIRTGTPIEEAGKQVGYSDHSAFYRAFKQTCGVSPREYKKQLARQETAAR